ncbi:MAG: di-trans,poly-cis-decaprenylcistransferase [Candidatus Atribacteria bacterium]|nr:di-trans,poly-cis-decaprenylcistransferase [Candidatus Atribacteria bacterium]
MENNSPISSIHVAIIMDGNGRWAEARGLPRTEGHKVGVKVVREIVEASVERGVGYLTLFAFSTENWKRSKQEVNFLFSLFTDAVTEYIPDLKKNSVKLNFIGDLDGLPYFLRQSLSYALNETKAGNKLLLTIAINYGGRREIVDAVNKAIRSGTDVDEESFKKLLYTKDIKDPDILIRTSGEMRISNFLLYQIAYTELFFTKTLWPDFTKEEYFKIIDEFSKRERRFGGV